MYQVVLTRSAQKDLATLDTTMRQRAAQKLRSLADNPRGTDSIKLSGEETYRTRVGDYRILYAIDDKAHIVTVSRIGHRRDVYG
jgi:mRNA interferase RelE/StbE